MTIVQTVPSDLLTYEQYIEEFETEPSTTQPYEILDGVRHVMNTPRYKHQRISRNITLVLTQFEFELKHGVMVYAPFDVVIRRIPKLQTRQPDLFFVSHASLESGGGIPDLPFTTRYPGSAGILPALVAFPWERGHRTPALVAFRGCSALKR